MTAAGYIYFIQSKGDGPIKIGFTGDDPRKRMVKIQSDCPWPVDLLGAIKGTIAQEKRIHLVLAPFRTQGEWFEATPIVLAAVAEALRVGETIAAPRKRRAAKYEHPLCLYRAANGLTLYDIAERTGLSPVTICRFEKGSHKPNEDSLRKLIRATGLSLMDLRPDLAKLAAEVA